VSTLAALRPRFSRDDAARLSRDLYGLEVSARALPSERDQNFQLVTRAGERYVLKIARGEERIEELELQNGALRWLEAAEPALPVPRVRPSLSGASTPRVDGANGSSHLVRLLTYLPGVPLCRVKPHAPGLLRSLGRFLGRVDAALEGFAHPAAAGRELPWDPAQSRAVIARHEPSIADAARRRVVARFVAQHEAIVAPLLPALRQGVIHNDANDHNLLVNGPREDERRVVGLVDFGDMVRSWTVCELAVGVAYAMFGKPDPLAAAAHVVAGYHETRPLAEAEIEALFTLSCLRLCTSVCLSAHRRAAEPEDDYLTISEAPAWDTLLKLRDLHPRFAHYRFRDACGLPPVPAALAVTGWLRSHRDDLGPVVAPALAAAPVFDLSVGSTELEGVDGADRALLERRLFGRMREAGAAVGVGRYDEARFLYASDAFQGPAREYQEWRTVHLGIDLFLAAGSPVTAPLAGRVHSVADNAGRLDYGPTVILAHEPPGGPRFFTLYGHLDEDALVALHEGQDLARGQALGRVGAPPRNGDWPPHVHFQVVADLLDAHGDFPGVADASQRAVWLGLCPDPNLVLRIPDHRLRPPELPADALLRERRERLGPSLSLAYRDPLRLVRGRGAFLYDENGRAFLDCVNNVAHVGHCHPRVVEAGRRQMAVLNTNTRYLHDQIVHYARRLAGTLPAPLRVCFFVSSGSEANELALRMARAHTGRRGLLVLEGAYHGNTQALIDASPYKFDGPGGAGRPPHVYPLPVPDDYRGRHRRGDASRGERFAAHVHEAAARAKEQGQPPAAFLCESLLGCGGQIELPPGYLEAAYRHARAAGAVCIADEVQVGFGRVGTRFWGFETQGVVPDIVTMGKPIGNGHPLGAVVTRPEIAASFANGMEYFNTFGGNPVSCAIGLAVLDVVGDEGLQARALQVGARLKAALAGLMARHPLVGDVRGLGLFLGVELVRDRESLEPAAAAAAYVVERLKQRGILVSTDGPLHNVVKLKPPLVFSGRDADRVVEGFDAVLGEDFPRARVRG
jgi:4-aminobutyrate aminotransferase-like enzyme/Ser/Thr protein kinase RdoA (MazF antagonist)